MRLSGSAIALAATVLTGGACVHTQQSHDLVAWDDAAGAIVVEDVRVFPATVDAAGKPSPALEHMDVVVQGGKITSVQPHDTGAAPAGALVIDGRKKTLLPGLVDAHAHTHVTGAAPWYVVLPAPEHVLQEALFAGTTTIHDTGGPLDGVLALKKRVADGEVIGPRMLVAGPMLSAPGGYPGSYIARVLPALAPVFLPEFTREIADAGQGKSVVDTLAAAGVDHIKIALADTPDGTPVMDAATVRAICDEAHAKGLKVLAHIDTSKNARLAADNGVDVLVHGVHSTELSVEDAKAIAAQGVQVVPTLVTFERLWELAFARVRLSKLEKQSVAVNIQRSLDHVPKGYVLDAGLTAWLKHLDDHRHARLHENTSRLRDAGVRILVGTDGHGSTASFPAGIHEEMRRLVEAGVPNAEVLLGATSWSAQMSTKDPTFGTIEPGKDADILIVEGNPLVDINATTRIKDVILRGRLVKRAPHL